MWSFLLSYIGVLLPPPSPLKWHCAPVSVFLLIHYPSVPPANPVPAIIIIHAGLFKLNDDFEAPPFADEEEEGSVGVAKIHKRDSR